MTFRVALAVLMMAAAAACSSTSPYSSSRMGPTDAYRGSSYRGMYDPYTAPAAYAPPMDAKRKVAEQDCSKPIDDNDGNLRCK
ncbi:MAG TPA: hypothetical protein VNU96_03435 [Burkholderiales bacterium]|jgi:hypothetical protein|nr:hypothetical protein [Burkholderiales bacterium]